MFGPAWLPSGYRVTKVGGTFSRRGSNAILRNRVCRCSKSRVSTGGKGGNKRPKVCHCRQSGFQGIRSRKPDLRRLKIKAGVRWQRQQRSSEAEHNQVSVP